jgi:hypothetical protein
MYVTTVLIGFTVDQICTEYACIIAFYTVNPLRPRPAGDRSQISSVSNGTNENYYDPRNTAVT